MVLSTGYLAPVTAGADVAAIVGYGTVVVMVVIMGDDTLYWNAFFWYHLLSNNNLLLRNDSGITMSIIVSYRVVSMFSDYSARWEGI